MKKELCPTCNKRMKIDKFIDEFTICVKCKHCSKKFKITHDEKSFPANINSFNWGAFTLWRWWGFFNSMLMLSFFGLILATFIKIFYILSLIDLLIGIYYGIHGNRISWIKKDWTSITAFEKQQRIWNILGFTYFIFMFIISIVLIVQDSYL